MDRRTFVKGAALGAVATASAAVVPAALADPTVTALEGSVAGAGAAIPTDVPAWLGAEPTIADADITAAYDTDILIVGAGCAGSAAAATAAELGLNFLLVERGA